MDLPIRLRPANQEDVPFIFSSWLKSYRNTSFARHIATTIYFTEHHKVVEKLVKRCSVVLAVNDDDPSQIYGFICAELVEGICCFHYIYVKHPFRHLGIAKTLAVAINSKIGEEAMVYTHHNTLCATLAPRYKAVYHPYIYINNLDQESLEESSESSEKEPSESSEKEPSESSEKEPSESSEKEPSASSEKEPSASSEKEPSASSEKEPSASSEKEPHTNLNKDPIIASDSPSKPLESTDLYLPKDKIQSPLKSPLKSPKKKSPSKPKKDLNE